MIDQLIRLSTTQAPGDYHHDALVSQLLVGYRPRGMIAAELFPVITVGKQSNRFAKVDKAGWFRRPNTLRVPGAGAREVSYTVSSDAYLAENYELATKVPWETIDNADLPFQPLQRGGQFLLDQLMLDYEVRVHDLVVANVGSSVSVSGADAFDQFPTSDPLAQFDVGREAIRRNTGYDPNACVIPQQTWLKLQRHPDVIRHVNPSGLGGPLATAQQFANLIGVERVLIPKAILNTAAEDGTTGDQASAISMTDVWSTTITLCYVEPEPGIMVPTYGYTFRWGGPNIGNNGPGNFDILRRSDSDKKSEFLRTGYYQDEKIVAAELGFNIATGIT